MEYVTPRHLALLALACALGATSGCYTVRYHTRIQPTQPPVSSWNHIFLWGLAGSATVDVKATCPQGLARLETKRTFGNLIVSLLTLGLYTPSSVVLWCGRGAVETERPTAWRHDGRQRYDGRQRQRHDDRKVHRGGSGEPKMATQMTRHYVVGGVR